MVEQLKNQKLVSIGRTCNLLWINLGTEILKKNRYGKEIKAGEYVVDFQCAWRIQDCKTKDIKLASGDMYEPCSTIEWSETFEWDVQGNNACDEKLPILFPAGQQIYVKDVFLSENGDLKLVFSNDLIFSCFVDDSLGRECWRFFLRSGGDHFVVSGIEMGLDEDEE